MKIVGVIQARMGSTRLPNKMMLSLHGKPIIEWVVERCLMSNELDEIIVALPDSKENNIIDNFLKIRNIKTYRGSENNVLNRFFEAAKQCNASHVVRICADNPLISPTEIDHLIQFYKKNDCDYAYNHIPLNNKYPDGLGAEILSFELLENINNQATTNRNKEHCCTYITDNPNKFSIKTFDPPNKKIHYPNLKFDVDTFDDYYLLSSKNMNINDSSERLVELFRE